MFAVAALHFLNTHLFFNKKMMRHANRIVWLTLDKKPSIKMAPEEVQGLDLLDKDLSQLF